MKYWIWCSGFIKIFVSPFPPPSPLPPSLSAPSLTPDPLPTSYVFYQPTQHGDDVISDRARMRPLSWMKLKSILHNQSVKLLSGLTHFCLIGHRSDTTMIRSVLLQIVSVQHWKPPGEKWHVHINVPSIPIWYRVSVNSDDKSIEMQ